MTDAPDPRALLGDLSGRVKKAFEDHRSLMGFADWFCQMCEAPSQHLRGSSQYIRDVFDHYGSKELDLPRGKVRRFKIFDAPFADGDGQVAGQEQVQNEIYRILTNFVRDGRVSRLIMLHGPNGSAKSSIVGCIQGAMEAYSQTPDGALYTYAWIFPTERIDKSNLGFDSGRPDRDPKESYAYLDADQVDARLSCELRDHPLFLLPKDERKTLIDGLIAQGQLPDDFVVSRYILEGDLSPRDRAIYDALLKSYDGDHTQVLRHVQVERFYISLKYGHSLATVEPQMHVDAEARQLTADQSISNLPRPLQSVPLYALSGPLVGANRGLLEFSDLLKRPVEAFKYLLTTSEEAVVALPQFTVFLDEVLIASSNEKQLAAFKEYPDWSSFKGRIELVRVPYLLRYQDEASIYTSQFKPNALTRPMAPHTVEVAARWAILTRLKAPDPKHYKSPLGAVIKRLTPMEKLKLYDSGEIPRWVSASDGRELSRHVSDLWNEYRAVPLYEGFLGASAREIRTALLNAASREGFKCLTPLSVLEELSDLLEDPSLYPYLGLDVKNGYHDNSKFVELVRTWWLDVLNEELRTSMGLVEESRHEQLFARYVQNVAHALKKEKILHKVTGKYVDPDKELMEEVESNILAKGENREDFQKAVISRIGAWGVDHPSETPVYRELFKVYIEKMEEDYYQRQRKTILKRLQDMLQYLAEGQGPKDPQARVQAKSAIDMMQSRFGYAPSCTEECAAYLVRTRYHDLKD